MKRLQQFLRLIASLLLIQGSAVILCHLLSIALASPWSRAVRPDPLHGWIHVIWAGLIWLGLRRGRAIALGWSLGGFYWLFGLLGLAIHHPLGLLLDLGENAFHFIVGATGLWLTLAARPLKAPR